MKIEIHELHIHASFRADDIAWFKTSLENIMATQAELAAQLATITATVDKIGVETRTLLTKIDELTAILATAGNTTPEVDAAVTALQDQANIVDQMVPDAE